MMTRGATQANVTVFRGNGDIDAGDLVEGEAFPILPEETLEQLIIRSKTLSADVLLRALEKTESGRVETRPLDKTAGSYFGFPTRAACHEFRRRGRKLW